MPSRTGSNFEGEKGCPPPEICADQTHRLHSEAFGAIKQQGPRDLTRPCVRLNFFLQYPERSIWERRPPAKPGPPSLETSQKQMLFPAMNALTGRHIVVSESRSCVSHSSRSRSGRIARGCVRRTSRLNNSRPPTFFEIEIARLPIIRSELVRLLLVFAALAASALLAAEKGFSASEMGIERLDPAFDALVPADAKVEKLAEGFSGSKVQHGSKARSFSPMYRIM